MRERPGGLRLRTNNRVLGPPLERTRLENRPYPEDDDSPRFLGAPAPTLVPPDCLRCHCLPFPFPKCEPASSRRGRGSIESCLRIRRCRCLRAYAIYPSLRYPTPLFRSSFHKSRSFADYSSRLISAPAHRLHLPSQILLHSTRFLVSFLLRSVNSIEFTIPRESGFLSLFLWKCEFVETGKWRRGEGQYLKVVYKNA